MSTVGILEFRKNIYRYIKNLPLTVTAKGKVLFYVTAEKEEKNSTMPPEIEGVVKGVVRCKHGSMVGLCKFGC